MFFDSWNGMLFRKGLQYKQFSIKQIDWSCEGVEAEAGQSILPNLEERKQFWEIYKTYKDRAGQLNGDSSDEEDSKAYQRLLL